MYGLMTVGRSVIPITPMQRCNAVKAAIYQGQGQAGELATMVGAMQQA